MSAFGTFWFLSVLGGSWYFLKTLLLMAKQMAKQAKGAPSGVTGSCPQIAWPISSGHAALVVCKMVAQKFIED